MGKMVDLTDQNFGRLTAIRPTDKRKRGCVVWECRCECGNMIYAASGSLVGGSKRHCGCEKDKRKVDLTDQNFGRLTAIRPTDKRKRGCVVWECKCECGNTALVSTSKLYSKAVRSCGCLRASRKIK